MKKIFVTPNFKQKKDDVVLYQTSEIVALNVKTTHGYKSYMVALSDEEIETMESELKKQYLKELNAVCDEKSRGAKAIIAGMGVSSEQMEEYGLVEDAINANDVDWFADEAKLLGTTAQDEFDKAKKQKEAYKFAHTSFKKLIRLYRRFVSQKIDTALFNDVVRLIEEGKEIGVGIHGTPTEVFTASKEHVEKIITS